MGILEKIAEIESEMNRTQKNKATEYHLGLLKGKLAKLRAELIEPKSSGPKGDGFDVKRSGDARVALIGFPSVGKSTLLSTITETEAAVSNIDFTTLQATPGRWEYNGAIIQMLDLPGIIEGAAQGVGRGRQVVSTARTADLILMMLDATKSHMQRPLLEKELEAVGIRLNKKKPNIYFKVKTGGGISYNATCKQSQLTEKFVYTLLHQYRIFNAEVLVREDVGLEDFIDVVVGNRIYIPCLYAYNKIDAITIEEVDRIAREDHTIVVSIEKDMNMDAFKESIWRSLDLLQVYTKRHSEYPDFSDGLILRTGATVEEACRAVHKSLLDTFKYALVWGKSAKHNPQRVGLSHPLCNEDVIEIVRK
ncbi:Ribosome-interacting GTPase 2 [Coemansia sp. RSA 2131]|nr:Ribosome-interacting GTPase 2 [Coemansia sp. RSA 638]KAJ2124939.1 Ribosome-interacting GTPase 2 [Coemansia sp. RSA 720]KAJ2480692.1 Ribosome-interacting GTPase 2 [Coemansia sp. RSA 2131]KAJ2544876.1 Ribosome-interacting GTPase 2 [Coemansia sp. RSA 1853]KAJ2658703.1 Ribosome-interacting GTPase 2 [Coemansia sp. RSA 1199]